MVGKVINFRSVRLIKFVASRQESATKFRTTLIQDRYRQV